MNNALQWLPIQITTCKNMYVCAFNLVFFCCFLSGYKWLALSLLFCFSSLLSKEQGITAVAVCFTYDVFIAQKVVVLIVVLVHTYNTQVASREAVNPLGPIALISVVRLSAS